MMVNASHTDVGCFRAYNFGFNGQEKDDEVKGNGNSLAFEYRIHDPRIGRFLSVNPLAEDYPYWTPYQFAGLSPIRFVELEGLEPGEPFGTKYEAALNFQCIYGTFSIQEGREYASSIYEYTDKDGNTKYSYIVPRRGSKARSSSGPVKKKHGKAVAGMHSHGAFDVEYANDIISPQDFDYAEIMELPELVASPDGVLQEYNPDAQKVNLIGLDGPSDPNDPAAISPDYVVGKRDDVTRKEIRQERKAFTEQNKEHRKIYKDRFKEIIRERKESKKKDD